MPHPVSFPLPRTVQAMLYLLGSLVFASAGPALAAPRQAPALSAPELFSGNTIDLQQFRGQVVLLEFWASWCGSCWRSFPLLAQLQSRYQQRGLVILAVTVDEDVAVAREFATRKKLPFILLEDHAGKVADRYDVDAMPHSVLIDANGTIIREFEGFGDDTERRLRDAVAMALESGAAAGAQPPRN
jgi:peroxiredoxin